MKRALALAACLVATPALADDGVPAIPMELPRPPTSPYVLSGKRFLETNVSATYLFDVNARTDAPADARTSRSSAIVGAEVSVPAWYDRFRLGAFAGSQIGYWGDDVHGPFSFYFGARARLSYWMGDVFDFYFMARADLPLTIKGDAGFRPGAGLGLRIARAISVEATYDVLVPIGASFVNTEHASFVPIGMSLSLLFDACVGCNRAEKKQVDHDMACRFYNSAKARAARADAAVKKELCDAVPAAMRACPDPLAASRVDDGMVTFLDGLRRATSSADARALVQHLIDYHAAMLYQWAEYEQEVSLATRDGHKLTERWTYAPVPGDLVDYLGCRGAPPADCEEVAPEKK